MTALKEEFFKSRRKHTFLIVAAFAAIELFWLLWSFKSGQKIENGWFDILYNIPVLDAVICPVLAAVTAGQNADLEHRGDTASCFNIQCRINRRFITQRLFSACWLWFCFLYFRRLLFC